MCLTGDVHDLSRRAWEQCFLDRDELDLAGEYADIATAHGIPVTLFVSGRVAVASPQRLRALAARDGVQIGGHWFSAFPWHPPYGLWGRLFGLRRGPASWQARDIRRTVRAIEDAAGVRIRAWRDHAYRHDRNTFRLLASAGIAAVSDDVDPTRLQPVVVGGVLSVPINVLPDHENIRHLPPRGGRPLPGTLSAPDWAARAAEQAELIVSRGGVATILAHPTCMKLTDDFASFRSLCAAIAIHRCVRMQDLRP